LWVTTRPVTTKQIESIIGKKTFTVFALKAVYKVAKMLFKLDQQTLFWEKFQPETEKYYIMFNKINLKAFKALFGALNMKV
jgi:hypothetical protein